MKVPGSPVCPRSDAKIRGLGGEWGRISWLAKSNKVVRVESDDKRQTNPWLQPPSAVKHPLTSEVDFNEHVLSYHVDNNGCVCARINKLARRQSIFISHTPSPLTCARLISTTLLQLPLLLFFCAKLSRRTLFSLSRERERKKLDPAAEFFQVCMCGLKKDPADNEMDFQRALSAPPALYCRTTCVAADALFVCDVQPEALVGKHFASFQMFFERVRNIALPYQI